ncbi:MAG: hypothetical protein IKH16_12230 [Selenomonadaceae bacterium]|nr:hypothetical protein [Selenomonadaceae bacterium]
MARNANIDDQIAALDEKIEKASVRIRDMKAKRQDLLDKKESLALQEIYTILQEKGISPSQGAEILRNHN